MSIILYGSDTWAVKDDDLHRLERIDVRIIRWMCNMSLKDRKPYAELMDRCWLENIKISIQRRKRRWLSFDMSKRWLVTIGSRVLGRNNC